MNTLRPVLVIAQADWRPTSLPQALAYTVLFSLLGICLAIVGYKLFDWATPGRLHEEIIKNRNIAAALVGAAVIVGVCILVAAAIMG